MRHCLLFSHTQLLIAEYDLAASFGCPMIFIVLRKDSGFEFAVRLFHKVIYLVYTPSHPIHITIVLNYHKL